MRDGGRHNLLLFIIRERIAFAGCSHHKEAMHTAGNLVVDDFPQPVVIDVFIRKHRRDDWGNNALHLHDESSEIGEAGA